MQTAPPSLPPGSASGTDTAGLSASARAALAASGHGKAFQAVWSDVTAGGSQVEVQPGDTLIGLVKAHHRQNQSPISDQQAYKLAHQIARDNQLSQPDLILPGQKIDFARLNLPPLVRAPEAGPLEIRHTRHRAGVQQLQSIDRMPTSADMLAQRQPWPSGNAAAKIDASAPSPANVHPVLERTLARAAEKGFVPVDQLAQVRHKVLTLAQRYNFAPDDFARLSLMESGGMNPQASNGNCHGIIQFCDGANRGAAAVGFKNNPRAILGLGLLQQLDLVDKYFAQAGLSVNGPRIGLDDLYLTVLTPAARQEKRPDAPLPIAGPQARALHVGGDTQAPITRNSILAGLHSLTQHMLDTPPPRSAARWYADMTRNGPAVLP